MQQTLSRILAFSYLVSSTIPGFTQEIRNEKSIETPPNSPKNNKDANPIVTGAIKRIDQIVQGHNIDEQGKEYVENAKKYANSENYSEFSTNIQRFVRTPSGNLSKENKDAIGKALDELFKNPSIQTTWKTPSPKEQRKSSPEEHGLSKSMERIKLE